jgi:hypothetical protein
MTGGGIFFLILFLIIVTVITSFLIHKNADKFNNFMNKIFKPTDKTDTLAASVKPVETVT